MIGAIFTKKSVRSAFDALNKGDVDKMLNHWNEDCTFFYPGKVKSGGLYTGKSELKKWLVAFFKQFPHRKYTLRHIGVENIFDMIGNNTVLVYFDLELTNKDGMKATNSGVSVITIKGAKAIKEEIFLKVTDGEEYKSSWGDIE
jgi:ketosteroid isomerase-like protein